MMIKVIVQVHSDHLKLGGRVIALFQSVYGFISDAGQMKADYANCKKFGKLHNPELGTPVPFFLLLFFKMANFASHAQMAELVDALDSKSGYRKVVQVRFLFWAQNSGADRY